MTNCINGIWYLYSNFHFNFVPFCQICMTKTTSIWTKCRFNVKWRVKPFVTTREAREHTRARKEWMTRSFLGQFCMVFSSRPTTEVFDHKQRKLSLMSYEAIPRPPRLTIDDLVESKRRCWTMLWTEKLNMELILPLTGRLDIKGGTWF